MKFSLIKETKIVLIYLCNVNNKKRFP